MSTATQLFLPTQGKIQWYSYTCIFEYSTVKWIHNHDICLIYVYKKNNYSTELINMTLKFIFFCYLTLMFKKKKELFPNSDLVNPEWLSINAMQSLTLGFL